MGVLSGNYWQDTLCTEQNPEPGVLVIFGASGDLARRKLFPALWALCRRGLLCAGARIIGCARHEYTTGSFRAELATALNVPAAEQEAFSGFLNRIEYCRLPTYDGEAGYRELGAALEVCDRQAGAPLPRTFYLATPSALYREIVPQLAAARLLAAVPGSAAWRHVVFEKPFGYDTASAEELDALLHRHLSEDQIYRIDHYLGKDTVQNILLLRFANLLFEPVWNFHYIDQVQITVAEELGVESRAGYYEQAGLLRDMFQNHMLEMLSMVAMECPAAFSADAVRDEKLKLLRSIRPFDCDRLGHEVVRGQYTAGNGMAGYRQEPGVAPDSTTETFVALRLWIDNWRWHGVPFYLRSGKRLTRRESEIVVVFKPVPHSIFAPLRARDLQPDVLRLRVQPEEGMGLTLQAKKPGPKLCMGALTLNYNYREAGGEPLSAYARLLLDCQLGDQTLFIRSDIIAAAWRLFQPVLDTWRDRPELSSLQEYPAGSRGPAAADRLLAETHHAWLDGDS